MIFISYILCSSRLLKLKTEGQIINKTGNLSKIPQNQNQNSR